MANLANTDHPTGRRAYSLSPPVQVMLFLALAVFTLSQLASLVKSTPGPASRLAQREQRIYVMNPSGGSAQELQALLNEGWRVVHLASAGSPTGGTATFNHGLLLENPVTKEQDVFYLTPGTPEAPAYQQKIADPLKKGWRITQITAGGAPGGGSWSYHTVFILEK
jgi:hypothetical protein